MRALETYIHRTRVLISSIFRTYLAGFVSGWPIHRCSSTHGAFRPLSGSLGVAGQRRSMSKGPVDSHEVTQHAAAQSSGFGMLEGEDASGVNGGKQSPLSIHWGVALTPESTGNQFSTTDVVSLNSIRSTLIRQVGPCDRIGVIV